MKLINKKLIGSFIETRLDWVKRDLVKATINSNAYLTLIGKQRILEELQDFYNSCPVYDLEEEKLEVVKAMLKLISEANTADTTNILNTIEALNK